MRENRDFVAPVNILTPLTHALFSWAARHTTVCLDESLPKAKRLLITKFFHEGEGQWIQQLFHFMVCRYAERSYPIIDRVGMEMHAIYLYW